MLLLRIGYSINYKAFQKSSYSVLTICQGCQNVKQLHTSVRNNYPETPSLSKLSNISAISNNLTSCSNQKGLNGGSKSQELNIHLDYSHLAMATKTGFLQKNVRKYSLVSDTFSYPNISSSHWSQRVSLTKDMQHSHCGFFQNSMTDGNPNGLRFYSVTNNKPAKKKMSLAMLKIILLEYGFSFMVLYILSSFCIFSSIYFFVACGVSDYLLPSVADLCLNNPEKLNKVKGDAASNMTFLDEAILIYTATWPLRLGIILFCVPSCSRYLRATGVIKRRPIKIPSRESKNNQEPK